MVIQQIDNGSARGDARGGSDRTTAVLALATIWLAKLATSFDWGSPNLGTGLIFTLAASVLRLAAAKVARPRALRLLAERVLVPGAVAGLPGSGVWSVVTLSPLPRPSFPAGRHASVSGALALSGGVGSVAGVSDGSARRPGWGQPPGGAMTLGEDDEPRVNGLPIRR